MNETMPLFNPVLNSETIVFQLIFIGGKLNQFIVNQIAKIGVFDNTQSSILLALIYMLGLFAVIKFQEALKPIIKIIIFVLIIYLIICFFG